MASSSAVWVKFFKDAGIPGDLSARYAVMFCDHRIQKDMLGDLDRDILSDIGISAVGDKMAILKQSKFVSEQAKRDKTSKLLADGIKTLESRSKPASPAARMINHSINSRSNSPSNTPGSNSPKDSSGEESSKKSVFARLGEDNPSPKKTGVFGRLGGETPGLQYAGVLKKAAAPEEPKKKVMVKTKSKSTSVLDRLGSPISRTEDGPLPDSSTQVKKVVVGNKLRVKKSTLLSQTDEEPQIQAKLSAVRKSITIKQSKSVKKPSNVLDRLGDIVVTSTTKQATGVKSPAKPAIVQKVIIRVPKKQSKIISLKRKSTGSVDSSPPKKPISSNTVSSTSSAGLFKGQAKGSSSVFARLGKK